MKQFTSAKPIAFVMLVAMLALFVTACSGDVGAAGARGAAGAAGAVGATGAAGAAGAAGATGAAGADGSAGADALSSSTGTSVVIDAFQYKAATDKDNNVVITIYGVGFLPNERVELVLVMPSRDSAPLLSATADRGGAFVKASSPFFTMTNASKRGQGGLGHYGVRATGFDSGNTASTSFVLVD